MDEPPEAAPEPQWRSTTSFDARILPPEIDPISDTVPPATIDPGGLSASIISNRTKSSEPENREMTLTEKVRV